MRTQVGIVGAGPAGLLLGHLLARDGIESVVLEARSRAVRRAARARRRARAGHGRPAQGCRASASGCEREGLVHEGIELRFDGVGHRIDLAELTGGATITVYGQQKVVKDLIDARLAAGGALLFEVEDVTVAGIDTDAPGVRFRHDGAEQRAALRRGRRLRRLPRRLPRGDPRRRRGRLRARVPVRLAGHPGRGRRPRRRSSSTATTSAASHCTACARRSSAASTCSATPDEELAAWPDERIWEELHTRFATRRRLDAERGRRSSRSGSRRCAACVIEPMQHGRLFLAGDAAHIVPPPAPRA